MLLFFYKKDLLGNYSQVYIKREEGMIMIRKATSEVLDIFCLCRDDIKRLQKEGILTPEKKGQGITTYYTDKELNKLLDIKMYLLAGYRISDMETIFTDEYDSETGIAEQIHVYKKRIQMLEFIQNIRLDLEDFQKLSQTQLIKTGKVSAQKSNLPEYGTDSYYDLFWNIVKLIFVVDFLSQKESFKTEKKIVLRRVLEAYRVCEEILEISGTEINREEIKQAFIEMANTPIEDSEIKEFVSDVVKECIRNRDAILDELNRENIKPITDELDSQSGKIYKKMMDHIFKFALDYFVDEEELFCVYVNFRNFVNGLDQQALEDGVIK